MHWTMTSGLLWCPDGHDITTAASSWWPRRHYGCGSLRPEEFFSSVVVLQEHRPICSLSLTETSSGLTYEPSLWLDSSQKWRLRSNMWQKPAGCCLSCLPASVVLLTGCLEWHLLFILRLRVRTRQKGIFWPHFIVCSKQVWGRACVSCCKNNKKIISIFG